MKRKTIFIFAYYSFKDPVFQSAVLPYFENFPEKEKFRFVLLTWEQKRFKTTEKERRVIKDQLAQQNIIWYNTNWHSGKFKLVKKLFDFTFGILFSLFLILKFKARGIYSEGFPGAIFGHFLSELTDVSHFVHTFEPHADYMIEAGVWTENSWESKLVKKFEFKIAEKSTGIFTATEAYINVWKEKLSKPETKFYRVPSCVELDLFQFDHKDRVKIRTELVINENEKLIIYVGKFGGMYWEEELFILFKHLSLSQRNKYKFLILTPEIPDNIKVLIEQYQLSLTILSVSKREVPSYLSAADFGICGIHNIPSRRYSSPIKDGEYWACGLPILIPKGISDDYILAKKYMIGVILEDTSEVSIQNVVSEIDDWFIDNNVLDVRKRARNFIELDRSVTVYQKLYKEIFDKI